MITLITGTPGSGKTAWLVQELTRLPTQRKIYVHGIPELKIAHEAIYCLSELCDHCRTLTHVVEREGGTDEHGFDQTTYEVIEEIARPGVSVSLVEEWPQWATPGSLIVLDEVQRVWRPTGSKVPDEIAALETHRHKGLDFWLISQGPHLFHANIRLLVGRHIHLVATWLNRKEYEFSECRQNTQSRQDAVVRPYTLPKKVFGLYKSASLHTKISHRKPLSLYVFVVIVILFLIKGYSFYDHFSQKFKNDDVGVEAKAQAIAPTPTLDINQQNNNSSIEGYPDFEPLKPGVPESAPAYQSLLKVTAVPVLAGCTDSKKQGCKCYTKQATPYPATELFCQEVLHGHRFNPYLQTEKPPEMQTTSEKMPNNQHEKT